MNLLRFACGFARKSYEVLAKSLIATALATRHIEFLQRVQEVFKVKSNFMNTSARQNHFTLF